MTETQPAPTPEGGMPTAYDPRVVEPVWSDRWEKAALFRADASSERPPFSIALPPPNITGDLHLGHAVNAALQDAWARYRRMTGYEVLWQPGTDHAAIATQNVIEKQLAGEGTTKEELGRAAFEERVAEWYDEVGHRIIGQLQELGASIDRSRLRFTLDEQYVRAVRTAFVHYYDRGLIYRGPRIVNWCPRCQSAISDLEVQWREHTDTLYSIRYPIEGSGETITIATVRPETMLFDTGLAVHPDDERYRHLVGQVAVLPLVGRRLPIVADPAVEREFGTGALKITPGHDPLDYELGQRHGLALINGMHPDGRLDAPELPRYDGLPALQARERVVADLRIEEAIEAERPYVHEVGHCDRCDTVLEPLVSDQWWLRMEELARRSVDASRRGEVRWHPERFERTYLDWLGGIHDWCVSRQLWLGHRIPVYTCGDGHRFASVEEPERCERCGNAELTQDPDVLDTWFSSALWPFATLGWPERTPELEKFYPTTIDSTDRGIINLWVTRMIFSGLEFTGVVPFSDVMIHATIHAADGRRMSKSLGTGVDPRDLISQYGADAVRAWATQVAMTAQDVRYDESRIEGYRRFANKLWNATRLVLSHLGDGPVPPLPTSEGALADRWILSRLDRTVATVTGSIEDFTFTDAITCLYDFAWHDFCDWYLEASKTRLREGEAAARGVAGHVLQVLLRLLHPFMPFLSEELWHRLPPPSSGVERDFLMHAAWPERDPAATDPAAEEALRRVVDGVEELR
ncbi:MAG: valine--tRNA ligase, partial [Candidatus Dormiibacterota bacterium]